MVKTYIILV